MKVYLDDVQLGYDLEADSTHNILDPYLNKLTFGGKRTYTEGSFRGCLENFTINGEVQALGDNGIRLNQLFANNTFTGKILNIYGFEWRIYSITRACPSVYSLTNDEGIGRCKNYIFGCLVLWLLGKMIFFLFW